MKSINIISIVTVEVTDEEARELINLSFEDGVYDSPYRDLPVPEWMQERVKSSTPKGIYIPGGNWKSKNI